MKLSDDYNEEPKYSLSVVKMSVLMCIFVVFVGGVVIYVNRDETPKRPKSPAAVQQETAAANAEADGLTATEKSTSELVSGSTLTSDQLDIWDELETETGKNEAPAMDTPQNSDTPKTQADTAKDVAADGNHTLIRYDNGTEEWVTINPYITKNKYDYSGLVYQAPVMKYYENSKKVSFMGVDISKTQGHVDFNKLKKAGVEFVMIRLGSRGYGSGQLVQDEYFKDYMKGASDAGMHIGVYFFSQAITVEEALEEANMVIEDLTDYSIAYPVVFRMEGVSQDTARVDALTRDEKTQIAAAFLKAIKEAGYKPMLYGNKEWLIKKYNLSRLNEYDIWLSQPQDVPDYPYKFGIWQYSVSGTVEGISGNADLNISFVDYTLK